MQWMQDLETKLASPRTRIKEYGWHTHGHNVAYDIVTKSQIAGDGNEYVDTGSGTDTRKYNTHYATGLVSSDLWHTCRREPYLPGELFAISLRIENIFWWHVYAKITTGKLARASTGPPQDTNRTLSLGARASEAK